MATPFGSEDGPYQSALNSEDESPGLIRSRTRRQFPNDSLDEVGWDLNDDGRPKTRRVNPQRLAVRLGPELVAEMEAYIVPGAKMPSFTIRKDFQERYAVDRRHIYDYFHSRGLRVAKEDKHTNLIRGRALKAQALAQAGGQSNPISDPEAPMSPRLHSPPSSKPSRPAKRSVRPADRKPDYMRRSSTALARGYKRMRDEDSVLPRSWSETALSQTFNGATSSETDTDWESASTSPQFTLPSETSDDNIEETKSLSDFLVPPSDFADSFLGSPHVARSSSMPSLEASVSNESFGPFVQMDDDRLLNRGERTEIYDLISGGMSSVLDSHYLAGDSDIFGQSGDTPSHKFGLQSGSVPDFSMSCDSLQSWLTDDPYRSPVDVNEDCRLTYGLEDVTCYPNYDYPVISSTERASARVEIPLRK